MTMFRFGRGAKDGVRFCDGCAEVTTAAERVERRRERVRVDVLARTPPH
jgi:hypothetical protein